MSSFLVNLARRSAGLAPVVRTRPSLPPVNAEPVAEIATERGTPSETRDAATRAPVAAMPAATPPADAPMIAMPGVMAMPAPAPVPIVQRAPLAAVSTPAPSSAPPMSMRPSESAAPLAPAQQVQALVPAVERAIAAEAMPDAPPAAPLAPRADALVPVIVPANIARGEMHIESPRVEPVRESVRIETRVIERDVPTASEIASNAAVVTIAPAATEQPPVRGARIEQPSPAPERTVHVRIGAIEIHGAAPAAATAPASPVAVPARNGHAAADSFDNFARLRSYAPWQW